ncbi:BZ3500_MvSof-1268-A1-R1_Chr4-3g07382 [Microbotryum saponariae]|uniref:BZ3500_MvSof-1268-A1-R1_Chr4-3g07382 protein n=1 Tax=Microbotryum saponariae TaxID=289078 RepID=A0A2X0KX05_9BASI|nr:BZ3500_MvSof-1268-A1-R1_Chr4-3g07382 [Microbotryum saponariae]SDA07045.1 BZ3501_MvSof-1269-A2-R1_Chr4-2g07091 [Microbotryum saponariae]
MSKRPSRASTSHVKSYNEDELELRGRMVGGRGRGGGERMGINEKQGGPLRVAGGAAWGVPVGDAEDDDDDDEDEGDEEDISSVYLQAIRAYESMALKKDQRRAEKALKDARAILTATSNEVDSNVRVAMAKADAMIKQASEAAAKATRESQENPSAQWAIAFSSQHAVAEQVTQKFDTVREDLKSKDGQLFQEMIEACEFAAEQVSSVQIVFGGAELSARNENLLILTRSVTERSSRNKKVFKKFKQAVAAQEHEAIEMARMYEESARAQIRYFKAAAKA